jgi:hypothetical protein
MATPTAFVKFGQILAQVWQGVCHFFNFVTLCNWQLWKIWQVLQCHFSILKLYTIVYGLLYVSGKLGIFAICLILLLYLCYKVITLSGYHCSSRL